MNSGGGINQEFVAIDVAPSGSRETQSGLNLNRPRVYGMLATGPRQSEVACIVMHPVSNFLSHYLLEPLAQRGIACMGLNSRYINNDTMLLVERVLQDLGAGVRFLRARGFRRIVLLGNSGGAALVSFYQAQAEKFTLTTLTDGSSSNLSANDFPAADAIALFGAHEGRPLLFEKWIDPAVLDERDPLTLDREIDMFNPANGPPYSAEFIARYRARQTERRDRIERWVEARLAQLALDENGPQDEAFIIHRTLADPRCLDLRLDANDRSIGTIWGDAREVNAAANSVGRFTSLRSFMSQWSSKSRMNGPYWLARTNVPVLHFTFTADASTFPSTRDMWMRAGSGRIENVDVPKGNHYLRDQPALVNSRGCDRRVGAILFRCGPPRSRFQSKALCKVTMEEEMKMRKAAFGTLTAALILGSVTHAIAQSSAPGVKDDEILIGIHMPLSGPQEAFGSDTTYAAKMWYEEINKKGGIHGRKIRTIIEDDKCNSTEVVSVVKKLITVDNVFMINGGACGATILAAREFVAREKVPYVMVSASGDAVLYPQPDHYMFGSFAASQRTHGATLVDFAAKHIGAKTVAYISPEDEQSKVGFAGAKAQAEKLGVTISSQETIAATATDVTAPLLKVLAARPDAVIITNYVGISPLIVRKAYEVGLNVPIIAITSAAPDLNAFAAAVGNPAALSKFYINSPLNDLADGPLQKKWVDMYKEYYPQKKPNNIMTYGLPSAMAVSKGLEVAGRDLTREKMIDAMETLNFDTGVLAAPVQFSKTRHDALRSTIFFKFDGKTIEKVPGVFTAD